MKYKV